MLAGSSRATCVVRHCASAGPSAGHRPSAGSCVGPCVGPCSGSSSGSFASSCSGPFDGSRAGSGSARATDRAAAPRLLALPSNKEPRPLTLDPLNKRELGRSPAAVGPTASSVIAPAPILVAGITTVSKEQNCE